MSNEITVRFVTQSPNNHLTRYFPGGRHQWGRVRFIVDDSAPYDWLVAYHDLPQPPGEIALCCPRENTIFTTYEPSAIKSYGSDFVAQFGWLLSCHEEEILPHRNRIGMQPGSVWFYGRDTYNASAHEKYGYDALHAMLPPSKTRLISTVCSNKQMKHTLHYRRFMFTQRLKQFLPELDVFGHGVNLIKEKADALDSYRYHLVIENDCCPHYWTEKLSDAFLGYTLPFYYGCPNVEEYFHPDSFIRIDINDPAGTEQIIRRAIADNEYEKRLPHIIEARRRVLEEHNLFAMLARVISNLPTAEQDGGGILYSRYRLMYKNPLVMARYLSEKLTHRWRLARLRNK